MEELRQNLPQWAVSNAVAVAVLLLAWRKPTVARICVGVIFLAASVANTFVAAVTPEAYLDYERFAVLDSYRTFIHGWFASHARPMVLSIATGQFVIAIGMFVGRTPMKIAIVGIVIFSLAIAPLGVGSAFPCSILLAIAAVMLWNKPHASRP